MKKKIRIIIVLSISIVVILSVGLILHTDKDDAKTPATINTQEEIPFKPSLETFLKASIKPIGSTLYVWGGGWNEEDTAAGIEAKTLDVSANWKTFYESQNEYYNYENHLYQIHDGLDCSGFVGWAIYQMMNTKNNQEGYVYLSGEMGYEYANKGWGNVISNTNIIDYKPGDILFNDTHVWICLGSFEDGSILLVHSAPPGVRLSATPSLLGNYDSQARQIASRYMEKYYPTWYQKFPNTLVEYSYLTDYHQFRWNDTIEDAKTIQNMSIQEILNLLYK